MKWQKLLTKNVQNLFLLIHQMKDLTWKKADLAEKLMVDVKTIDRYLKRLEEKDIPIQLIQQKKVFAWSITKDTANLIYYLIF